MKKFGLLILALIAFSSGVIITFQYVGKDHGVSIFKMFKRPDVIEKQIKVPVIKILVVSDDIKLVAINSEYRDALLKISSTAGKYDNASDAVKELNRLELIAVNALKFPEQFAEEE